MHRPERLKGSVAHVRAHAIAVLIAPSQRFFLLLPALLTAQFPQIFHMLSCRFLAEQIVHPAIERAPVETMVMAVGCARQTALTPRFHVNSPVGLTRRVLEMSQIHRRSSQPMKTRHEARLHQPKDVQEPDAYVEGRRARLKRMAPPLGHRAKSSWS